ncbi:unnamed protein product [Calypogeia fissa]
MHKRAQSHGRNFVEEMKHRADGLDYGLHRSQIKTTVSSHMNSIPFSHLALRALRSSNNISSSQSTNLLEDQRADGR